jgi:hypothetical protein
LQFKAKTQKVVDPSQQQQKLGMWYVPVIPSMLEAQVGKLQCSLALGKNWKPYLKITKA